MDIQFRFEDEQNGMERVRERDGFYQMKASTLFFHGNNEVILAAKMSPKLVDIRIKRSISQSLCHLQQSGKRLSVALAILSCCLIHIPFCPWKKLDCVSIYNLHFYPCSLFKHRREEMWILPIYFCGQHGFRVGWKTATMSHIFMSL